MQNSPKYNNRQVNRRSFLRKGAFGTGAVVGIACVPEHAAAFDDGGDSPLNRGDIAILTFLSVQNSQWFLLAEKSKSRFLGSGSIVVQPLRGNRVRQKPRAKQLCSTPTVHLALQHFETIDLPLHGSVTPGLTNRGFHRFHILFERAGVARH
jgi:hypothetical protein